MIRNLAKFTIYKDAAVLNLSIIGPTWSDLSTKAGPARTAKPGGLLLEVAPGEISDGQRRFKWSESVKMSLTAAEVGGLLVDIPSDGLRYARALGGAKKSALVRVSGSGITLNMVDEGRELDHTIGLTHGEFATIRSLSNFSIPIILGFSHGDFPDTSNESDGLSKVPKSFDDF